MKFLNAVFWEFLQNTPVIVLLAIGVWFWAQQARGKAILCVVTGSIAGSLVIRFTEPLTSGHWEPMTTTIVNIVSLCLLQILFIAYLGSEEKWSNWRTDLIMGVLTGTTLAIAQGASVPSAPLIGIILHSIALASAGAAVLVSIRKLKGSSLGKALEHAMWITVVMTALISIVDYGYLLFI